MWCIFLNSLHYKSIISYADLRSSCIGHHWVATWSFLRTQEFCRHIVNNWLLHWRCRGASINTAYLRLGWMIKISCMEIRVTKVGRVVSRWVTMRWTWMLAKVLILHPIITELRSYILDLSCNKTFQKWSQLVEFLISHISVPSSDVNSIVWLSHKIFLKIINDNCLLQIAAQPW
jgi:hypothetical protein